MKNLREVGLKFLGSTTIGGTLGTTGIALITVLNNTTGKYIDANGTSFTSITSTGYVARTFDTWVSTNCTQTEAVLMYWISLVAGDTYTISVSGSGTKNIYSSGYNISYLGTYDKEPWVDGHVVTTLRFWHTSYPTCYYDFITSTGGTTFEIEKIETFVSNGLTNTFTLDSNYHAYEFTRVSLNGVWLNPYDTSITWGSNNPNYDDETMDSIYKGFTVKFLEIPAIGSTIIVEYVPLVNTYYVTKQMVLPTSASNSSIVDTKVNLRELSYGVEIV